MRKTILFLSACIALASCTDESLNRIDSRLDEGEQAVQKLGDRIYDAEQALLQINTDIRTLLVLRGGVTVNDIQGSDSQGWVLTLGDGRQVTVPPQGPQGNAPVVSMDEDGFWMIDYGSGPVYILDQEGNKVNQEGKGDPGRDAEYAPTLGVTEEGYWQVSYDGGDVWIPLLDVNGNPVPTLIKEGETIFDSVQVDDITVTFKLTNGETFTLPLVLNFLCSIQGASELETFAPGQTKEYTVQMEGISSIVVTAPNGWSTAFSGTTLSVTAPDVTKVYFDSEKYVSIYAISVDGHSVITSIKVAIAQ